MRAVALDYEHRTLGQREVAEPAVASDTHVLFQVHEVGVCGTDRELAEFHFGFPPAGSDHLIIGHEAIGQVVEVGSAVENLRPGDWVAPMIRRSCEPPCASCARGRRDLCTSGGLSERGIFGLHGYFSDRAVDEAADLLRVPATLASRAVLIEPLSVVEKAVETALRLHQGEPRTALVLGAGPIGILAALVLRLRSLEVRVHSLEPADHPRAKLVETEGMEYATSLGSHTADLVMEATGSPEAALVGVRRLAPLGVCVILGGKNATGEIPFEQMVLHNQAVVGSVNASPQAFQQAVADLGRLGSAVDRLIHRVGFDDFERSILGGVPEAPKLVHRIAE
ncbi:MAG: alcohol dehydrogenase catalytic domain-containing protein [bacterium]|nr:alcohol dehydrogenase catalytic domain-containing protein [bacterium]